MKTFLIATLAALVVFAIAPQGAAQSASVSLKIGQTVTLGDLELTLRDVSDSRCPRTVVCFWEGMAGARIQANVPGGDPAEFVIYTHNRFDMDFEYAGRTVTMANVTPYPESPGSIEPEDYTVSVLVTGAENVLPAEPSTWGAIKALYR